ncbi:MAG: formylglycine-generating enzyme family protein [Spirochaetes bacterium]|nr:formylglycine-generating enzyme family protein [Spirochaetota bacterium]
MKKNRFYDALAALAAALVLYGCASAQAGTGVPLDAAQDAAQDAQDAALPGQRITSPAGIVTLRLPAGVFTMGSPAHEIGRGDWEGPQRQVTISEGFWMGVYPVTQEEWERVMGGNPSFFPDDPAAGEAQGRRPVENVTWHDAIVFANRLSLMEGLSPAYRIAGSTHPDDWGDVPAWDSPNLAAWNSVEIVPGSNGWRLPTEAQWEYAARAGTATAFSNGTQDWNDAASLDGIGWLYFNSGGMTHAVGRKAANPWGLHDMHGNVWEWVWDWWGVYTAQDETDPAGASSGTERVLRGGSWFNSALDVRSAFRNGAAPSSRNGNVGLRLVRP